MRLSTLVIACSIFTAGISTSVPSTTAATMISSLGQTTTTMATESTATTFVTSFTSTSTIRSSQSSSQSTSILSTSASIAMPQDMDSLPFQPQITPAIGMAGVVLMLSGLVYTIIGIKNQRVQVFLSVGYLTSLAVTVLLVYVMNPPVSDAVQGAYFVAAVATGTALGVLAIVFKELADGLGCILGGYCLSMWLLALRPGGLLVTTASKGAFIGAFAAASYALSFFPLTKPYPLIGSLAFAGATATVLGIDCFSRADLNGNVFPLGTVTYPVTRGIRVELAGIILICIVGVLSQFKLWKVIRERRKRQVASQEEAQRRRDEADTQTGRRIEKETRSEMLRWEATYGRDIIVGLQKNSKIEEIAPEVSGNGVQVKDRDRENKSRQHDDSSKRLPISHSGTTVTLQENEQSGDVSIELSNQTGSNTMVPEHQATDGEIPTELTETSTSFAQSPKASPLPFKIPEIEGAAPSDDGHSVAATIDDCEQLSTRASKRFSGISIQKRFSIGSDSRTTSPSEEAPVDPSLSPSRDPFVDGDADNDKEMSSDGRSHISESNLGKDELESVGSVEGDPEELPQQILPDSSSIYSDIGKKRYSLESEPPPMHAGRTSLTSGAVDCLPSHASKVVMSYRTNEWAKHLAEADIPEPAFILPVEEESAERTAENDASSNVETTQQQQVSNKVPPVADSNVASEHEPSSTLSRPVSDLSRDASIEVETVQQSVSNKEPPVGDSNVTLEHEARSTPSRSGSEFSRCASIVETIQQQTVSNKVPSVADSNVASGHKQSSSYSRSMSDLSRCASIEETVQQHIVSNSGVALEHKPGSTLSRSMSDLSRHSSIPVAAPPELRKVSPRLSMVHRGSGNQVTGQSAPIRTVSQQRRVSSQPVRSALVTSPIDESKVLDFRTSVGHDPSLLERRDDMIRNKISSTSLDRDSWIVRSDSRRSLDETQQRTHGSRSNLVVGDAIPLTQRRSVVFQDPLERRVSGSGKSMEDASRRRNPVPKNTSTVKTVNTMAAWRESLRQDARSQESLADVDAARLEILENQRRTRRVEEQQALTSQHIQESIAVKMQQGEMRDLHRDALRKMQAAANERMTGTST
ncbi:hypothetical protein Egran_06004 [Elaphomyces granulatus]|uniref:TM7S3/TM198-like domain-containing protein n=1 Tax=Elaphomyces granulatus TaxID=519963 RepID=A0A232LQE9_9EURO|nr:hypothetical protein Egran_06004 [Elaphomyces granulatus]